MNKKTKIIISSIITIVIIVIVYFVWGAWSLRGIPESHLDSNVIEQQYFDEYLKRDLLNYFVNNNVDKNITSVDYELLRDEPTQSGLSYPKYYLWVQVYDGSNILEQGAITVASAEKKRFIITKEDYLSYDEIKSDPDGIYVLFPKSVAELIKSKL